MISGNVEYVNYQKGQIDQFYHHYEYDADNRITNVYTSADNVIWERDAKYFYHLHGPLARMELGDQKVQAMDYAYTIQGWIKGVNSNILSANNDLGADGKANTRHQYIGTDAASYSLNYFRGDYHSIGTSNGTTDFLASIPSAHTGLNGSNSADNPNLYNGNISSMVTTIMNDLAQPQTQLTAYKYDQLNRIKQLKAYRDVNFTTAGLNTFAAAGSDGKYQENFTYDANGNILKLHRNGNLAGEQLEMDSLSYVYENKTNNYLRNTNRLRAVHDKLSLSGYYPDDIDNQQEDNYTYDEIGNLKSDVQEQIQEIKWNVYGKVQEVIRTPSSTKPNLEFVYDASGNRIAKIVKQAATKADAATWTVTYYMRDAQGNVLSTYEKKDLDFKLEEQYLYGSSRLGLKNRSLSLTGASSTATIQYYARSLSTKTFELSNHLGNVLSTVSDRKMGVSLATSPTLIDHYTAVVLSSTDYYAFGSPMPGRTYSSGSYRYGFNGKEKDDEFHDNYDYGMRIYDPRLGKFLTVDPLFFRFPYYTPYQFAGNKPIYAIDLDGTEDKHYMFIFKRNGKGFMDKINVEITKKEAEQYTVTIHFKIEGFAKTYKANSQATLRGRDDDNDFEGDFSGVYTITKENLTELLLWGHAVIAKSFGPALTAKAESVGQDAQALLDFKFRLYEILNIDQQSLIEIDGVTYNANEAGNYLWGLVLEFHAIIVDPAEQADKHSYNPDGTHRRDEAHEQAAIKAGMEKGKELSKNGALHNYLLLNHNKYYKDKVKPFVDKRAANAKAKKAKEKAKASEVNPKFK